MKEKRTHMFHVKNTTTRKGDDLKQITLSLFSKYLNDHFIFSTHN
jgi:hypothetical protein